MSSVLLSLPTAQPFAMSTRRSARISAASIKSQENKDEVSKISLKRKDVPSIPEPANIDAVSSTPKRKKVAKPIAPPFTPTPGDIGRRHGPYASSDEGSPPPVTRLAVPTETNATLVSPESRRVVAQKPLYKVPLSSVTNVKTITTSENILDKALAHLIEVEPKLKPVIANYPCNIFSSDGLAEVVDPFNSLVSGIISQQVSGAAAKSIKAKFVALFNVQGMDPGSHVFPNPTQVASKTVEYLRGAGLSQRKAEFVHGLAEKFRDGELTTKFLFEAPYEEVFDALIKVRGLGPWSVQMFACFGLKRFDVFAIGDLGVQKGMAVLDGRDVDRLKAGTKKFKVSTFPYPLITYI